VEAIETYLERSTLVVIAGATTARVPRATGRQGVRLPRRGHRREASSGSTVPTSLAWCAAARFKPGTNRKTLGIDGTETSTSLASGRPRADLVL